MQSAEAIQPVQCIDWLRTMAVQMYSICTESDDLWLGAHLSKIDAWHSLLVSLEQARTSAHRRDYP